MNKFAIPALVSAFALAACGTPAEEAPAADDTMTAEAPAAEMGTVVDVAAGNPDFSTLVTAVTAAGLGETLSGEGPFTVFAPNNAAFAKLPEGTVETLVKPESKDDLTAILTYHVVAGKTMAAALGEAIAAGGGKAELTTVQGATLTASVDGETVILTDAAGNTAKILTTDIEGSNGVIHVIDSVVMPK